MSGVSVLELHLLLIFFQFIGVFPTICHFQLHSLSIGPIAGLLLSSWLSCMFQPCLWLTYLPCHILYTRLLVLFCSSHPLSCVWRCQSWDMFLGLLWCPVWCLLGYDSIRNRSHYWFLQLLCFRFCLSDCFRLLVADKRQLWFVPFLSWHWLPGAWCRLSLCWSLCVL